MCEDQLLIYNNRVIKKATIFTLLALFTGMVILPYGQKEETPKRFTTNIDFKNQTINDDVRSDSQESSFWKNVLERGNGWFSQSFNLWRFYQNLANPSARYVVINSGLRKEEVAEIFAKELKWNADQKYALLSADKKLDKKNMEGRYSPGGYLVANSTEPETVYQIIIKRFNREIRPRYATSTNEVVDMNLAIKIASIIEREAAGKRDMKLISGIIWNRVFKNMKLEMDATLQYAKGNSQNGWWPRVKPEDKYIDSPYNTYKNIGLPPTPISNVSAAAIIAALNPQKTKCLFYLHDKLGMIHCSQTYKEHQRNIKKYYR